MTTVYGVFSYDPSDLNVSDIIVYINRMLNFHGPTTRFSVGFSEVEHEEMIIVADTTIDDPDLWVKKYIDNNRKHNFGVPEKEEPVYREGEFHIDDCETSFPGYTHGGYWNGWSMPAFTKEVADKIVEVHSDPLHPAKYDKSTDTYLFCMGDGTGFDNMDFVDAFPGADIAVDGVTIHVYPIGSGCWIWCDTKTNENEK